MSGVASTNLQALTFEPNLHDAESCNQDDCSIEQFFSNPIIECREAHNSNAVLQSQPLESSGTFYNASQKNTTEYCNASESHKRLSDSRSHIDLGIGETYFSSLCPNIECLDTLQQPFQFNPQGSEQGVLNQKNTSVPSQCNQYVGSSLENLTYSHLQNLEKMTPPFENVNGSKISSDAISSVPHRSNTSVSSSNVNASNHRGTGSYSLSSANQTERLTYFDPGASVAAMRDSTISNSEKVQSYHVPISNNVPYTPRSDPIKIQSHVAGKSLQTAHACSFSNHNFFPGHGQFDNNSSCSNISKSIYSTTAMPFEHTTSHNVSTCASFTSCQQGSNAPLHSFNSHHLGNEARSCSVTNNHPIMHASVTPQTSNSSFTAFNAKHCMTDLSNQNVTPSRNESPLLPRGPQYLSETNMQIKAETPNTIQYLPARQQQCALPPHRPQNLDFLQRYAAPLTNLDNKVPTHNLQYFPNSGVSNLHPVQKNIVRNSSSMCNPSSVNPTMESTVHRVNSNAYHPKGQFFPPCAGVPSEFGHPSYPTMVSSNSLARNKTAGGFRNKLMPTDCLALETTQPLPPSMGHVFNYKQSPFYGATPADPSYAAQFHNFQQQLYATNTRSNQTNSYLNMTNQRFLGSE